MYIELEGKVVEVDMISDVIIILKLASGQNI